MCFSWFSSKSLARSYCQGTGAIALGTAGKRFFQCSIFRVKSRPSVPRIAYAKEQTTNAVCFAGSFWGELPEVPLSKSREYLKQPHWLHKKLVLLSLSRSYAYVYFWARTKVSLIVCLLKTTELRQESSQPQQQPPQPRSSHG